MKYIDFWFRLTRDIGEPLEILVRACTKSDAWRMLISRASLDTLENVHEITVFYK